MNWAPAGQRPGPGRCAPPRRSGREQPAQPRPSRRRLLSVRPSASTSGGRRSTTASSTGVSSEAVPDLWRQWGRDPAFVPEGGESLASVGARVRAACEELWAEAAEQDIVVVTHVSPIKAAVAWALGVGDEISWRMFVDVASVTRVGPGRPNREASTGASTGGPRPSLRQFNETHHRPSE